ncbi:MAG: protein kinase [Gemmataceae bacterium]|nr:protein kinase [Gemmataceae bacterium]
METNPTPERDQRLDEVLLAYLDASESDPNTDKREWLARHPDLAPALAAFFEAVERVDQLTTPLRDVIENLSAAVAEILPLNPRADPDETQAPTGPEGAAAASPGPSVGGYEILEALGRGGMGVVYKARQKGLGRLVALKMIRGGPHAGPDELARFRGDAQAIASLKHPNIVQIYEIGEQEGLPYFSLELLDGGSLADALDGTPWKAREAAKLTQVLAEAMHAAHQKGVIHRDLKPGNVLLADDDTPKITDFGLARRVTGESALTQTGTILGTPSYMAPEQAQGKGKEVGPEADVYALGAILYELLTGRAPFRAESAIETVLQVVEREPVAPRLLNPKASRDLETICLKCLQKDPHRRYASAQALAEDLGRFLEGKPILARPVGALERFWRWCRRYPARAGLLFVCVILLLVLLGVGYWVNRSLRAELERTEAAATIRLAERIDSDLRQLARTPEMMAATLEQWPDWTEAQLDAWMRAALGKDGKLFGTTVAFEPYRFDPQREDFALYAYRKGGGLATKQLEPPDYKLYRTWNWYTRPKQQGGPVWSEPFVDEGGGGIPMITYSVPLRRDGKFVGVVTADLSIGYFQVLRGWLADLKMGEGSYGFVVSREGTFISHPSAAYQLPLKITESPDFQANDELRSLSARLLREERGTATAVDPYLGRPARFHFARIPSAGWTFVAVVGE